VIGLMERHKHIPEQSIIYGELGSHFPLVLSKVTVAMTGVPLCSRRPLLCGIYMAQIITGVARSCRRITRQSSPQAMTSALRWATANRWVEDPRHCLLGNLVKHIADSALLYALFRISASCGFQ